MKIIHRGNSAAAALLLIATSVSGQEATRPIIPGNDQQTRQQEEARERERAVSAPGVRSEVVASAEYPTLPSETPCFRIERFVLQVPDALPASLKSQGASALPMDRFAFAREWLGHYTGQCVGKQGLDLLVKGLSQAILARGYVTTRVLVPEQDLSSGTLMLALIPGGDPPCALRRREAARDMEDRVPDSRRRVAEPARSRAGPRADEARVEPGRVDANRR